MTDFPFLPSAYHPFQHEFELIFLNHGWSIFYAAFFVQSTLLRASYNGVNTSLSLPEISFLMHSSIILYTIITFIWFPGVGALYYSCVQTGQTDLFLILAVIHCVNKTNHRNPRWWKLPTKKHLQKSCFLSTETGITFGCSERAWSESLNQLG